MVFIFCIVWCIGVRPARKRYNLSKINTVGRYNLDFFSFVELMKLKITHLLLFSLGAFVLSCQSDEYQEVSQTELDASIESALRTNSPGGVSDFIMPDSDDLAAIPQDPLNPLTPAKVALGKMLLHETAIGGNPKMSDQQGMYACASCHNADAGFFAGKTQGIGEGGWGFGILGEARVPNPNIPRDSIDFQPIKAPTLLNLAYQDVMLWDGSFGGTGTNAGTEHAWTNLPENAEGFQGIEVQAMQGQVTHRLRADPEFIVNTGYRMLYDQAFPEVPRSERYSKRTTALAIAAFNRTILANESPWQYYLRGDYSALRENEKRGALLFFTKARCAECHTGPALKSNSFHAFGLNDFDGSDGAMIRSDHDMERVKRGRGGFTQNPADNYKFKTPQLYNMLDSPGLGHGGSFGSVRQLIEYKINGVKQNAEVPDSQLAEQFGNIQLTSDEITDLTAFIENALYDPYLQRYTPEVIESGNCFPVADQQSSQDLGCN